MLFSSKLMAKPRQQGQIGILGVARFPPTLNRQPSDKTKPPRPPGTEFLQLPRRCQDGVHRARALRKMACCSTKPDVSPPSVVLFPAAKNEETITAFWDSSSRPNSSARKASRAGPAALHCSIHLFVSAAFIAPEDTFFPHFQQTLSRPCQIPIPSTPRPGGRPARTPVEEE